MVFTIDVLRIYLQSLPPLWLPASCPAFGERSGLSQTLLCCTLSIKDLGSSALPGLMLDLGLLK